MANHLSIRPLSLLPALYEIGAVPSKNTIRKHRSTRWEPALVTYVCESLENSLISFSACSFA
jgi:hypothetical protein